jgi:hypothetical protein
MESAADLVDSYRDWLEELWKVRMKARTENTYIFFEWGYSFDSSVITQHLQRPRKCCHLLFESQRVNRSGDTMAGSSQCCPHCYEEPLHGDIRFQDVKKRGVRRDDS